MKITTRWWASAIAVVAIGAGAANAQDEQETPVQVTTGQAGPTDASVAQRTAARAALEETRSAYGAEPAQSGLARVGPGAAANTETGDGALPPQRQAVLVTPVDYRQLYELLGRLSEEVHTEATEYMKQLQSEARRLGVTRDKAVVPGATVGEMAHDRAGGTDEVLGGLMDLDQRAEIEPHLEVVEYMASLMERLAHATKAATELRAARINLRKSELQAFMDLQDTVAKTSEVVSESKIDWALLEVAPSLHLAGSHGLAATRIAARFGDVSVTAVEIQMPPGAAGTLSVGRDDCTGQVLLPAQACVVQINFDRREFSTTGIIVITAQAAGPTGQAPVIQQFTVPVVGGEYDPIGMEQRMRTLEGHLVTATSALQELIDQVDADGIRERTALRDETHKAVTDQVGTAMDNTRNQLEREQETITGEIEQRIEIYDDAYQGSHKTLDSLMGQVASWVEAGYLGLPEGYESGERRLARASELMAVDDRVRALGQWTRDGHVALQDLIFEAVDASHAAALEELKVQGNLMHASVAEDIAGLKNTVENLPSQRFGLGETASALRSEDPDAAVNIGGESDLADGGALGQTGIAQTPVPRQIYIPDPIGRRVRVQAVAREHDGSPATATVAYRGPAANAAVGLYTVEEGEILGEGWGVKSIDSVKGRIALRHERFGIVEVR